MAPVPERDESGVERRFADLEMRLAFQEHALQELSDALAEARAESTRNQTLLLRALEDLKQVRGLLMADPGSEPPPPHY